MSTTAAVHPNNFMEPEPHIVERLKSIMPANVHVLTAKELAAVKEDTQPVPAVHVIYNGFRVLESRGDARVAHLDHEWLVVAAVRNVSGLKDGANARQEAGLLAGQAGAAVMGYRPPNVAGPLRLAPSPGIAPSPSGYLYLPLAFLVESVFRNSDQLKGA